MYMNIYLYMYSVPLKLSQQKLQIKVAPESIKRKKNAAPHLGTPQINC